MLTVRFRVVRNLNFIEDKRFKCYLLSQKLEKLYHARLDCPVMPCKIRLTNRIKIEVKLKSYYNTEGYSRDRYMKVII